jgi:hypothetical protein
MCNLKSQWAINPTAPQTRQHRTQLSKVIQSYTVRLTLEAACKSDPGVYACGSSLNASNGTQAGLTQGIITTLARMFKITRTSDRGSHVCEWLRLRNSSPIACVVVQRASRRVKSAGRCRTVVMTLSPHVDVHNHMRIDPLPGLPSALQQVTDFCTVEAAKSIR